jgi:hypothetical protein
MAQARAKPPALGDQLAEERRRVDFDSYDITVQQLVSMVGNRQIDVAPAYQRRFRWDAARQSELVESLFLGIPIPNLFMATNSDSTWEVVDGVQRLSTIVHFCGDARTRESLGQIDRLRIEGLQKLTALNGLTFDDLPQTSQLQFNLRPLKVTTLSDKSDLKVRFDLFERLNTGGVRLSAQEIRGCIYRGAFNDFLEKVAADAHFRKVVALKSTSEDDGTREEYVLRFFAFLHAYRKFDHSVVGFLNEYMAASARKFDFQKNEDIFRETFSELSRCFPGGLKRRTNQTPVNLFEAVSVGAALALTQNGRLRHKNLKWVDSDEMRETTTGATNNRKMVTGRIEFAAKSFGASI